MKNKLLMINLNFSFTRSFLINLNFGVVSIFVRKNILKEKGYQRNIGYNPYSCV